MTRSCISERLGRQTGSISRFALLSIFLVVRLTHLILALKRRHLPVMGVAYRVNVIVVLVAL